MTVPKLLMTSPKSSLEIPIAAVSALTALNSSTYQHDHLLHIVDHLITI
jgi:hypothetical protein